jgi:twinkle protein
MDTSSDSEYILKGPCEGDNGCGSSDACALYTDGHTYCFSCGRHTNGEGGEVTLEVEPKTFSPLKGKVPEEGLSSRRINSRSLVDYRVTLARDPRRGMVQVYPYYDKDGNLCAQHLRTKDKDFPWLGNTIAAVPFGSRVRSNTGKRLIVTEGELDALAAYQMFGYTWPVWSIGCGAGPQVRKYIGQHRELFRRFDEVVICFDNDEQGRTAAEVAAEVIGHDICKIADLPEKDASDMLKADLVGEFKGCIYNAKRWTPDELLTIDDLDFEKQPEEGLDFGFPSMTELSMGLRMGEIHMVGAGTAAGKTDFMLQIVQNLMQGGTSCATFMLEQAPLETGVRLAGKFAGKPLHIPQHLGGWTPSERSAGIAALKVSPGKLHLYDSFGINEWSIIGERMRYLAYTANTKVFILDHITALAASTQDERKELDVILAEMGGLVKELDCAIIAVSHLARPEGTSHEEGGRIQLRHMRGSHSIGIWSHYAWGLERNQQHEDPTERRTTTVRCLKDRYTGRATGKTFKLRYDQPSGTLEDLGIDSFERVIKDEDTESPFKKGEY